MALVRLGLRLVSAAGPVRPLSIAVGAAVATLLILVAAAIPDALFPPEDPADAYWRANMTGALLFALTPAIVLLVTTSRISSSVRDRRLTSLRLIGMDRPRVAIVAAVEAGVSTAAGAVTGALLFNGLSPVVDRLVASGPGWFARPLHVDAGRQAAITLGVIVVASSIASTPLLRQRNLLAERSGATRRRPSRWRLAVPLSAFALFGLQIAAPDLLASQGPEVTFTFLLGGALLGAVGIVLATPVLADALSEVGVRTRRLPLVMAARGIQAEPLSSSRLVAGLAVTIYLVIGGSAVLQAFESTPQHQYAIQALDEGPQRINVLLYDPDAPAPLIPEVGQTQRLMATVAGIPGVEGVTGQYSIEMANCQDAAQPCRVPALVGSCDQLALLMTMHGCDDSQAAWVASDTQSGVTAQASPPALARVDLDVLVTGDSSSEPIRLSLGLGPMIEQDTEATARTWVDPSSIALFIPADLIRASGAPPYQLQVVATGGTQVRQAIAAALPAPAELLPSYSDLDAASVARVRLVVLTLSAMAVGTALLGLLLTTVDHARERRQVIARQLALGVPGRLLYLAQLLQVLVPLFGAITAATILGWAAVRAWAAVSGWPPLADTTTLALIATASLTSSVLVAAATIPAIRTRLTPTLLRRE